MVNATCHLEVTCEFNCEIFKVARNFSLVQEIFIFLIRTFASLKVRHTKVHMCGDLLYVKSGVQSKSVELATICNVQMSILELMLSLIFKCISIQYNLVVVIGRNSKDWEPVSQWYNVALCRGVSSKNQNFLKYEIWRIRIKNLFET